MSDIRVDAATLHDEKQRDSRPGFSGINVIRAENEFNTLARSLSKQSAQGQKSSTVTVSSQGDVEKAGKDVSEQFDLREYLTSSNDAYQQAGIKHKVSFFFSCFSHFSILNGAIACGSGVGGSAG